MLPDITGPKVLPPSLLFVVMSSGVVKYGIAFNALLMIIALTFIFRYVLKITYKPADIIMPALLYGVIQPGNLFVVPAGEPESSPTVLVTHTFLFAIMFALIRVQFPSFY
jgi:hypothetical protein